MDPSVNNSIPTSTPQNRRQHVQYSWIPTLSLGPSSTVSIHVHHASLPPVPSCSSLHDEKKDEDESTSCTPCRIEACVSLYGEDVQAVPVATRSAALESNSGTSRAGFDEPLRLPVRWRDLSRDASLVLNVVCEGGMCGDSNDDHNNNNNNSVWGTTLPLFDSRGVLRTGLQKLKLHRDLPGDGGVSYAADAIDSFLTGGATPGIEADEKMTHPFCRIDERKLSGEEDRKWKASLILHELHRESASASRAASTVSSAGGSPTTKGGGGRATNSWLDDLRR